MIQTPSDIRENIPGYRNFFHRMAGSYLDAAAWTEEESLDEQATDGDSIGWHKDAMDAADKACNTFLLTELTDTHLRPDLWDKPLDEMPAQPGEQVHDLLERIDYGPEQAGHDLWLTRNHHGVGFWDRGLGEAGAILTRVADEMGEQYAYVGDDDWIYLDGGRENRPTPATEGTTP